MSWYNNPNVLPFDAHPERKNSVCRFIFTAPAGMLSMEVPSDLPCEAWCNGEKMLKDGRLFKPMTPAVESAEVILEIREAAGRYEGGTLDGFIKFNCGKGLMPLGDWSEVDSLRWYSGGIRYERDFSHPRVTVPFVPSKSLSYQGFSAFSIIQKFHSSLAKFSPNSGAFR